VTPAPLHSADALATLQKDGVAVCFTRAGVAASDTLVDAIAQVEARVAVPFVRVDLDDARAQALVEDVRVHKVPELLVYKGGRILGRMEGAMRPERVEKFVAAALARA
jgi:hypothetical protein